MRKILLNSKYSNMKGYHFSKKIPLSIDDEDYLYYGVPFKFGFINEGDKYDFNVPNIRTRGTTFLIQTYRSLDFKTGDRIRFDNRFYDVENVSTSFSGSNKYKPIKQYFLNLKWDLER